MSLMSAKKLLMQGARKVRPQDVFATSLYTGNGGARTITNGLDLAGKGGLAWIKKRSAAGSHALIDTARGAAAVLSTDTSDIQKSGPETLKSFLPNGFTLGTDALVSDSGASYAAWSFRRARKFFDIVTYTGNGNAQGQFLPHSLGALPGMIIVKRRDAASNWAVWHRGDGATGRVGMSLNTQSAALTTNTGTPPHSTAGFDLSFVRDASGVIPNENGATYVAYLFAQNPDLIDCGSYVGNGSTSGPLVTCGKGWKPQWLLIKSTGGGTDWVMLDTSRDAVNPVDGALRPNSSGAEFTGWPVNFLPSGFQPADGRGDINAQGGNPYIYLAIRSPT